jgi:hypothetical protein
MLECDAKDNIIEQHECDTREPGLAGFQVAVVDGAHGSVPLQGKDIVESRTVRFLESIRPIAEQCESLGRGAHWHSEEISIDQSVVSTHRDEDVRAIRRHTC